MKSNYLYFCLFFFTSLLFAQENVTSEIAKDTIALPEVVIVFQRKAVKISPTKTVLDLQNSVMFPSKLLDAMRIVPGIHIDKANKKLSFENKNVQVYVDGQQIMIPSESVYSYIQSIPTATIKKIDFISNPGAKYDAGYQGAIISLTTKKVKKNQMEFSPYFNISKHRYYNTNYGVNLFGKWKKIEFAVTYDNYNETIFNDKESKEIYYKNEIVDYYRDDVSKEIVKGRYQNINTTIGYKSKNDDFIFSYIRNAINPSKSDVLSVTDFVKTRTNNQFKTETTKDHYNNNNSFTTIYTHKFDTLGTMIKLFFDHTNFVQKNDVIQKYTSLSKNSTIHQRIGTNTNLNSLKIDFNNRQEAKYYLEMGAKYSWTTNDFHNFLTTFNDYQFGVKENIYSHYFSVKKKWENINILVGVRAENTILKGMYYNNLNNDIETVDKDYFRLFPNISLEYLWTKNSLSFIVDTKIQRPNYTQYNPLRITNDLYSVSQGNPMLSSASSYNYSIKYTFNKLFSFQIFFINIKDQIGNVVTSNNNNISVIEPINLDYARYYGVNMGGRFNITKWWEIGYWGQIQNLTKRGNIMDRIIRTDIKNNFYISLNQSFQLPKGYYINVNSDISGNNIWGIYQVKSSGGVSINAKKAFLNNKLNVEISLEDIFNTNNRLSAQYQDPLYYSKFTNYHPGRSLNVGLSYNFNTTLSKIRINTDTEEKSRIK